MKRTLVMLLALLLVVPQGSLAVPYETAELALSFDLPDDMWLAIEHYPEGELATWAVAFADGDGTDGNATRGYVLYAYPKVLLDVMAMLGEPGQLLESMAEMAMDDYVSEDEALRMEHYTDPDGVAHPVYRESTGMFYARPAQIGEGYYCFLLVMKEGLREDALDTFNAFVDSARPL